jgi:hypothetical protein
MPRGDRSGPEGKGPKTGRRKGLCAGNDEPGYKQNRNFAMSRRQQRQTARFGRRHS